MTVAFNNAETIKYQNRTLAAFFENNYQQLIVDNSTDQRISESIFRFCIEKNIWYVKLPKNPWTGRNPSASHGVALNWMWENMNIIFRNAPWIGFLDHDVYLVRHFNINHILSNKIMYGKRSLHNGHLYCWPGLVFAKKEYYKEKRANFKPGRGVDAGGNFFIVTDEKDCDFPSFRKIDIEGEDGMVGSCQMWGETWIHVNALSGWDGAKQKVLEDAVYEKIDNIIHI